MWSGRCSDFVRRILHDDGILRAMDHHQPRQTPAVRGNHDVDAPFPEGVTGLHLSTFKFESLDQP